MLIDDIIIDKRKDLVKKPEAACGIALLSKRKTDAVWGDCTGNLGELWLKTAHVFLTCS